MRIPWRGKNRNLLTVGPGKTFQFSSIQSAWDSISDASSTNPYLIAVAPGLYTSSATIALTGGKTDIAIVSETRHAAVVARTSGASNIATLQVGDSTNQTKRIALEGLRLVAGTSSASSGDAALSVGVLGSYPTVLSWDEIFVVDCVLESVANGLEIVGQAPAGASGPAVPGRLWLQDCLCRVGHIGVKHAAAYRLEASGVTVHANSDGVAPYATAVISTRVCALDFDLQAGIGAATDRGAEHYCRYNGLLASLEVNENIGTMSGAHCAILQMHAAGSTAAALPHKLRLCGSLADIVFNGASQTPPGLHGAYFSDRIANAAGDIVIDGFTWRVFGKSQFTPTTIRGVMNNASPLSGSLTVDVLHGHLEVRNDRSGGTAYAMGATQTPATIRRGGLFSAQAIESSSGTHSSIPEP